MGEEENRRVYQGPAADDSRRNELQDHLIFTEGTVENRLYHKSNPFCERLRLKYKQIMSELKSLEKENTEASEKFSELTKEAVLDWEVPILTQTPKVVE
ncbi:hypothetical protein LEMLEM_LOCUS11274 [Lemmus lemmus]